MGEAFLTRRGGGYAFAQIDVEYPEGSTCTCSNGTRTLTAKTTGGKWIFNIPSAGTWTVTATDGDKEKSQSVSITTKGQIERVNLLYRFILHDYESGESADWAAYTYGVIQTESDGALGLHPNNSNNASSFYTQQIDVTEYTKLHMEYKNSVADSQYNLIGLAEEKTSNVYTGTIVKVKCSTTNTLSTVELDISSITGSYYVAAGTNIANPANSALKIYRAWLE